jgi:hypothetical protein
VKLPDEAIAVAVAGGRIAVLARRSLRVLDERGRTLGLADLTGWASVDEPVPRRAIGRVAGDAEGAWDVWSTFLPPEEAMRFRLEEGGPLAPEPVGVEPPEDLSTALLRGWPGPVVEVVAAGSVTFFHLGEAGDLVAEREAGGPIAAAGPIGEPLAAVPSAGGALVYASSPSIPGEPDRLIEHGWDGAALAMRRQSRPFEGRVAALAFRGDRAVVAVVDRPRHTRLLLLDADDLWTADP